MNSVNNTVYPLAFPKGLKFLCELCQKPAHKICDKCRVTYYCDTEHQHSDWYGIHEKICQSLIELRTQLPFLPSDEERKKRDLEIRNKKLQLIEYTRSISQRYLFEGLFERAIPGATTSLRLAIELFGLKSVDLVPSYLILGEASQGLGSLSQAQEYLSQAEWTVAKNTQCPNYILSKLYRNMAMLQMVQGNLDHALRNLANDIYCASEEFGTNSIKVSGGYFLMANIFLKLEKMQIADSLYRQVTNMWYTHLKEVVYKKTEISDLDSILGKRDDDDQERDFVDAARSIELASEAEARKVLYAIYDLRKNETEPDLDELNSIKLKFITHFYMFLVKKYYLEIEHSLSMIHFLSKDYEKVDFYTSNLMQRDGLDEDMKKTLNRVVSFINAK